MSWPEFAEMTVSPLGAADVSAALGVPLVLVDVTGPTAPVPPAAAEAAAAWPAVVAGVGADGPGGLAPGTAALLDVVVADPAPVAAVVERSPQAAVTLALTLRASGALGVGAALAAESAAYSMLQAGPEFARWREATPRRRLPGAAAAEPAVLAERAGGELRVRLNRPARHNAVDTALRDGLVDTLLVACADPSIGRVVLDGAGPSFCSGGDLDDFGTLPDPATAHVVRLTRSPARLLAALASRLEVRVHGACIGAGIEMAAFAGRVVARPDTVISLPEVGFGLIPGAGGTVSLPRRIGRHRTAELALRGASLDAATALRWGLVDAVER
jgi:hypothetical protein